MASLAVMVSCLAKNGTPAGIIPKDQMQSILEDIHYAQAKADMDHSPVDSVKITEVNYYNRVFSIHHVTAKQFLDSFDFYTRHPDIMDDMYQNMINELGKDISTIRIKTSHIK
jgi:hypothetical protein